MVIATSIEFFKNLAQYDYDGKYYDLHNDYDCEKIFLKEEILSLCLKKNSMESMVIFLKFTDVEMTMMNFFNFNEVKNLTIDNIYRGRFEIDGQLNEVSSNGKAYFYVDFYEGQSLEFWAKSVEMKNPGDISD